MPIHHHHLSESGMVSDNRQDLGYRCLIKITGKLVRNMNSQSFIQTHSSPEVEEPGNLWFLENAPGDSDLIKLQEPMFGKRIHHHPTFSPHVTWKLGSRYFSLPEGDQR